MGVFSIDMKAAQVTNSTAPPSIAQPVTAPLDNGAGLTYRDKVSASRVVITS